MARRGFGLFIGVAFLLVAAAAWRLMSLPMTTPAVSAPVKPAPDPVRGNRLYLSAAQRAEAVTTAPAMGPIRSLLNVRRPLHYGDFVWDDARVPTGPIAVRIDLGSQMLSVFRGGDEIGTAVIVYGTDGKPTPIGTFPILARMKDHQSAQYDAEMPFTLRLTPDGVAIHASSVEYGHATHGCVGVPIDFARHLFDATRVGDKVTILPA